MAYNLLGFRNAVKLKLQNHDRFTDALIDDAINKGIDDIKIFDANDFDVDNCNVPVDPANTSQLVIEWPLPDNCLYVKSVSFDGLPLDPLPHHLFAHTGVEANLNQGRPRYFYIRKNSFINLWPRPQIADAAKTVQVYSVKKDPDLVLDTDAPLTKRVYTISVEFYAAWYLLNGQPEEEVRTENFLKDYYRLRAEAKFNLDRNIEYQTQRQRW